MLVASQINSPSPRQQSQIGGYCIIAYQCPRVQFSEPGTPLAIKFPSSTRIQPRKWGDGQRRKNHCSPQIIFHCLALQNRRFLQNLEGGKSFWPNILENRIGNVDSGPAVLMTGVLTDDARNVYSHAVKPLDFHPYFRGESRKIKAVQRKALRRYYCRFKESYQCYETFTRIDHASRHSKIHTAERAVACIYPSCKKVFARMDNMKQHLNTHCKEIQYDSKPRYKDTKPSVIFLKVSGPAG